MLRAAVEEGPRAAVTVRSGRPSARAERSIVEDGCAPGL
jgi:hypothetical protein